MKRISLLVALCISLFTILTISTPASAAPCLFGEWICNGGDPSQIPVNCPNNDCSLSGSANNLVNAAPGIFEKVNISDFIINTVKYFLGFVTLIAVIYVLYAGFQLMTSGGDEEKLKKARKIIIYVIAGIILMWSAYWIVRIILDVLK